MVGSSPSPAAYSSNGDDNEGSVGKVEAELPPDHTFATGSVGDEERAADLFPKKGNVEEDLSSENGAAAGSVIARAPATPPATTPVVPNLGSVIQQAFRKQEHLPSWEEKDRELSLEMDDFMDWCRQVMGIETSLEIKYFDYPLEYLREWDQSNGDSDFEYEDDRLPSDQRHEIVKVRGLAATRDIKVGDVIISIPLNGMVTIKTTVDHDPVLSRVLGPESRAKYGWDTGENAADYEIPILIAALLYHRSLGRRSPLASYMHVLESAPVNSIPFLWNRRRLRTEASEGVRKAVHDVRADIRDMYDAVIEVLVKDYPIVFGPTGGSGTNSSNEPNDWFYSHKNFQWAFAMVNSRHWHVPVVDLDDEAPRAKKEKPTMDIDGSDRPPTKVLSSIANEMPPAEQPTDEYVQLQEGMLSTASPGDYARAGGDSVDDILPDATEDKEEDALQPPRGIRRHSFLAPLADLLNFGPPCTRGVYDPSSHRFEIIATCTYRPGQEVTFYYSDDCSDLIFANYGFVHPMVPKCPSADEYRTRADGWREYAERLEGMLEETYREVDRLEDEAGGLYAQIRACGGCGTNPINTSARGAIADGMEKGMTQSQPTSQQERERAQQELERSAPPAPPRRTLRTDHRGAGHDDGIRGGSGDGEVGDDREPEGHGGIRRIWIRPKSDRGL